MNDTQIKQKLQRAFDAAAPELPGVAPLPRSSRKEPAPSRRKTRPALRWAMAAAAAVLVFFCGFAALHGLRARHADAFPAAASLQEQAPAATPSPKPVLAASLQEPAPADAATVLEEARAKQIILGHANVAAEQVQRWYMKLDRENGRLVYEAEFAADGYEYEYDIDAVTGEVLKNEREQLRPAVSDPAPTAAPAARDVSRDEALAIALRHAGVQADQAQKVRVENDREDGRAVYEVEFTAGGYEYDYEIDAVTGEVLKHEREKVKSASKTTARPKTTSKPTAKATSKPTAKATSASTDKTISRDEALAIALKNAGVKSSEARKVKVEKDRENGRTVYEVDFTANGYEYEYEIDASSGRILHKERERDDD